MFPKVVLGASIATAASYVPAPGGSVLSHCNHQVESGTSLAPHPKGGLVATSPDGTIRHIPKCETNGLPLRRRLSASGPSSERTSFLLPTDYDGWTSYTAFQNPSNASFDAMTGFFSTPTDLPKEEPQILFIFPGLQNEDWIPKHDPEPAFGFDIVQPVLQYPGDGGRYWSVKSWYVTTDVGTVSSQEIRLNPGDNIFGNMTRLSGNKWIVDSVVNSKHTSITADHPRLASQPWAYNTIECYGCRGCGTYPTAPTYFTKLQLLQGTQEIEAKWVDTPKKPAKTFCKETATITDSATVTFGFD